MIPIIKSVPYESSKIQVKLALNTQKLSDFTQMPTSSETAQKIYLVRHGESTANVYFEQNGKKVRYVSGQSSDVPLTEKGRQQIQGLAVKLSELLPKEAKYIILNSSAVRTQQTAEILFNELAKTHKSIVRVNEAIEGLNERFLGPWEGCIKDESYSNAEAPWRALSAADKFISAEVEGAESYDKVAERALLAIEKLYNRFSDSTILAVTSFNTINAAAIQLNKLKKPLSTVIETQLPKLNLGNGDLVLLDKAKSDSIDKTVVAAHIQNDAKAAAAS